MLEQVLDLWFNELTPERWWVKDAQLDGEIRDRFGSVHAKAARCELDAWRSTSRGQLAEIIVLDQFSRNLFRDSPQAFACDAQALALAQQAIVQGALTQLNAQQSVFLCLPFMHSESALIHERAVGLFTRIGLASNLEFELKHKAIIDRFGRYPHRNAVLGRISTPDELSFLEQPGSAF